MSTLTTVLKHIQEGRNNLNDVYLPTYKCHISNVHLLYALDTFASPLHLITTS